MLNDQGWIFAGEFDSKPIDLRNADVAAADRLADHIRHLTVCTGDDDTRGVRVFGRLVGKLDRN
ncbi:hypothetical protein SDC9_200728 [bioreactor metagenome]|uniref:Uncharacterized protein n=1 Tax=bioreactor metagenome TaxID=1076179 RepID=A0A645INZ2_9ZZZZ